MEKNFTVQATPNGERWLTYRMRMTEADAEEYAEQLVKDAHNHENIRAMIQKVRIICKAKKYVKELDV